MVFAITRGAGSRRASAQRRRESQARGGPRTFAVVRDRPSSRGRLVQTSGPSFRQASASFSAAGGASGIKSQLAREKEARATLKQMEKTGKQQVKLFSPRFLQQTGTRISPLKPIGFTSRFFQSPKDIKRQDLLIKEADIAARRLGQFQTKKGLKTRTTQIGDLGSAFTREESPFTTIIPKKVEILPSELARLTPSERTRIKTLQAIIQRGKEARIQDFSTVGIPVLTRGPELRPSKFKQPLEAFIFQSEKSRQELRKLSPGDPRRIGAEITLGVGSAVSQTLLLGKQTLEFGGRVGFGDREQAFKEAAVTTKALKEGGPTFLASTATRFKETPFLALTEILTPIPLGKAGRIGKTGRAIKRAGIRGTDLGKTFTKAQLEKISPGITKVSKADAFGISQRFDKVGLKTTFAERQALAPSRAFVSDIRSIGKPVKGSRVKPLGTIDSLKFIEKQADDFLGGQLKVQRLRTFGKTFDELAIVRGLPKPKKGKQRILSIDEQFAQRIQRGQQPSISLGELFRRQQEVIIKEKRLSQSKLRKQQQREARFLEEDIQENLRNFIATTGKPELIKRLEKQVQRDAKQKALFREKQLRASEISFLRSESQFKEVAKTFGGLQELPKVSSKELRSIFDLPRKQKKVTPKDVTIENIFSERQRTLDVRLMFGKPVKERSVFESIIKGLPPLPKLRKGRKKRLSLDEQFGQRIERGQQPSLTLGAFLSKGSIDLSEELFKRQKLKASKRLKAEKRVQGNIQDFFRSIESPTLLSRTERIVSKKQPVFRQEDMFQGFRKGLSQKESAALLRAGAAEKQFAKALRQQEKRFARTIKPITGQAVTQRGGLQLLTRTKTKPRRQRDLAVLEEQFVPQFTRDQVTSLTGVDQSVLVSFGARQVKPIRTSLAFKPIFKESAKSRFLPSAITIQKPRTQLQPRFLDFGKATQLFKPKSRVIPKQALGFQEIVLPKQITPSALRSLVIPKQALTTRTITRTRTPTLLIPKFPLLKKTRIIRKGRPEEFLGDFGSTQLFKTQVKVGKKDKFKSLKGVAPKNIAYNKGFFEADNTIQQTVQIVPTKRINSLILDDPFLKNAKFRKQTRKSKIKGKPPIFIEKRQFAIDTLGERQGLKTTRKMRLLF